MAPTASVLGPAHQTSCLSDPVSLSPVDNRPVTCVCVCVRHGQDVGGWRPSARFWTKYGNMLFHICWKSWQHKKQNSVLGWKPFRVYPGCSISRPPANRPTNHTHTAMPLRMQSSITSNLEIRHRLLNSMKRPRDTSHNVHRNSPCPSETPVGDKASLRNFTDRFTHGTTKCLWTWKMSVSQRNYSKPAGG